uniref:Small ribosomal subunit protein bS20c n=1 Tax=Polysiphonia urceolata TaxID=173545 RepID=A0A1Z1MC45_POLUR|nr:ribosomal protein S20 [Polysiphonia stricta]ARW63523.1 ribosomal protein S20 [Polysiphonia stricta]
MPQTKSHIKNTQIILRNRSRNKKYKLAVKKAIKSYLVSLKNISTDNDADLKESKDKLSLVYKTVDKAVKSKVLHKNNAARKKSRLTKMISKV